MIRIHANGNVAELRCDRCGDKADRLLRTWQEMRVGNATGRRELWVCAGCMGRMRTNRAVLARDMFKRGATAAEVAEEFGVSAQTAKNWLRKYL